MDNPEDSQQRFSLLRSIDPGILITPFIGFLLLGAGLLFMYWLGQVNTLTCRRELQSGMQCHLVTTWMELVELDDRPLAPLSAAYVDESCDEDGCTYRVLLSTARADLPLIDSYSSGITDKQLKVDQIQAFLTDANQTELKIKDGGGFFIIIPVAFAGAGLWMCITSLIQLYFGKPTAE